MDKRARRRIRREEQFGPERTIVSTEGGVHTLECGHIVNIHPTERDYNTQRRCDACRIICGAV